MIARAAIPSNEEDFLNSIIDLYEKRVQRKAETDKNRNESMVIIWEKRRYP